MEAALTNNSYTYRAPVRYVAIAAGFLVMGGMAAFCFATLTLWVFKAIFIFIMSVSFIGGLAFIAVYLQSLNNRIVFLHDMVILPQRRKCQPVLLDYSEITVTEERHFYGRSLRLSNYDGSEYILDETWMERGRFDDIAAMFRR